MFLANCSRFHKFSQLSQFSSRNKGFLFISPTGKPPIRAVPPIFRTSTCLWDNRNRFVSKEVRKNWRKWVWLHSKIPVSALKSMHDGQLEPTEIFTISGNLLLTPLGLDFLGLSENNTLHTDQKLTEIWPFKPSFENTKQNYFQIMFCIPTMGNFENTTKPFFCIFWLGDHYRTMKGFIP